MNFENQVTLSKNEIGIQRYSGVKLPAILSGM